MTYGQMAETLGLRQCRGITPQGFYCTGFVHEDEGSAEPGVVHFADRQVRRPETLAFLRLAAQATDPTLNGDLPWRRVYRMNHLMRSLARRAHVRYPTRQSRMDRAFVLAGVAGLRNDVPMRKQAFDWARRGPR